MIQRSSTTNPQSWYFTGIVDSRLEVPNGVIVNAIDTGLGAAAGSHALEIVGGQTAQVRDHLVSILTTSGYKQSLIELNHVHAKAKEAAMIRTTDWKNVEITFYCKIPVTENPVDMDPPHLLVTVRGGKKSAGRPCEGTHYGIKIFNDGRIGSERMHWYSGGRIFFDTVSVLGNIEDKRIGIKVIVYNNKENTAVTIDVLVDINEDNKWITVYSYTDTGIGEAHLRCGDETTRVITWGGPVITIQGVHIPKVVIDSLSVREIDPFIPKIDLSKLPVKPDPEFVSPPDFPPTDIHRIDFDDDSWDDDLTYPLPPWGEPGDNVP
jgi:hypothetical protein